MSILDSKFKSESELREAARSAPPLFESLLTQPELTPRHRSIIELMREGFTLAEILDIPQKDRDAILGVCIRLLKAGQPARARDILSVLMQIDPQDPRVIYTLAGCYQLEGNLPLAAQLYLLFLARDATNPQGYFRLGECLLAAKEYDKARDSFRIALIEEQRAGASLKKMDYARRKMAEAEAALVAQTQA